MRVAVLGDVHGWSTRLDEALTALGADTDAGILPDGIAVVQVGDLVHKGPDSVGVLALVDRFLAGSPGRWRQLLGNHEAHYLGGPRFSVGIDLDLHQVMGLARWHRDGHLGFAAAVTTADGDVLVTHAGLTGARWRLLGEPTTAAEAAAAIEEEVARLGYQEALRPGEMLSGGRVDYEASVVWASCNELLWSWTEKEMPFSQVVGHTNPYTWRRMGWPGYYDDDLRKAAILDPDSHHVQFTWPTRKTLTFIDPTYGKNWAGVRLVPHVVEGAVAST